MKIEEPKKDNEEEKESEIFTSEADISYMLQCFNEREQKKFLEDVAAVDVETTTATEKPPIPLQFLKIQSSNLSSALINIRAAIEELFTARLNMIDKHIKSAPTPTIRSGARCAKMHIQLLYTAVLDAVEMKKNSSGEQITKDAIEWIRSPDESYLLYSETICKTVQMNREMLIRVITRFHEMKNELKETKKQIREVKYGKKKQGLNVLREEKMRRELKEGRKKRRKKSEKEKNKMEKRMLSIRDILNNLP